jgi:hypothetical protein
MGLTQMESGIRRGLSPPAGTVVPLEQTAAAGTVVPLEQAAAAGTVVPLEQTAAAGTVVPLEQADGECERDE